MKKIKKIHSCKITTLKNQEWIKNRKDPIRGVILASQCLSNVQVMGKDYNFEVSNPGQRGGICKDFCSADIFDIVCNPRDGSKIDMIKKGYLGIVREKIANDLNVYERLLETMKIKDPAAKISWEDVSKHITENTAKIV